MAEETIELIHGIDTKIVLDELYYTVKGAMNFPKLAFLAQFRHFCKTRFTYFSFKT